MKNGFKKTVTLFGSIAFVSVLVGLLSFIGVIDTGKGLIETISFTFIIGLLLVFLVSAFFIVRMAIIKRR